MRRNRTRRMTRLPLPLAPRLDTLLPLYSCPERTTMPHLHLLSPLGFRATGVYAGIKTKQSPDVGLLIADALATAAACFTTNPVFAAPVKIGRRHVRTGKLRGVVVNSG